MPINRLIRGFKAFRHDYYDDHPEIFETLVSKGQSPKVMVIACADSRVNPSIIGRAEPGELFILRNVANLVPPYEPDGNHHGTSAAIEYAVRDLVVEHIVVLGHSHCGGIQRLCTPHESPEDAREFIDDWIEIVAPARDDAHTGDEFFRAVERNAVVVSLTNLNTFPWIKERIGAGNLELHGWWFDLEAGQLMSHQDDGTWEPLTS